MSASLPDRDSSPRSERTEARNVATPGVSGEMAGVFEQILQETSQALVAQEPLTAAERRAFEEVALRFRGQSIPLESIVAELVFAVLQNHISGLPGFGEFGRSLAERVTRTLIDDPAARLRLESLWNHLKGGPA